MLCTSCGSEVLPSFKHAIARNECPACGGLIMGEEFLAAVEDVGRTVLESASVREETAHNIALAIVAKYNLDIGNLNVQPSVPARRAQQAQPAPKIAPPSAMRQAIEKEFGEVVSPEVPQGISDVERERIMEEAVRKKYNMVDHATVDELQAEADRVFPPTPSSGEVVGLDSIFSEGASNPVLEEERLYRLAKQKRAMEGGGDSAFRRSS